MTTNPLLLAAAVSAALLAHGAHAAVSAEEAKQLGATLTPWGAEKAGNKEGTIPAYTGQPVPVPATYDRSKPGQRPDPFNDKPLFSVTAQNYGTYADKLDGAVEMFKRFPNYRMNIYPTHRSWVYPKYVVDNTLKNATSCKAANEEQSLEGCYGGFPFPVPKTGTQVMWNHLLQFESYADGGMIHNFVTPVDGGAILQNRTLLAQQFPYYDPSRTTPVEGKSLFLLLRSIDQAPTRITGGGTMLHDPVDWTLVGRRAFQYIPGQRRVKLAPTLAYDTPSPYAGGGQTMDEQKGFMGAMDRFEFKLIGKKEKFIPYNNYATSDFKTCPGEKMFSNPNFPDPECVRWELHRVWVVEAKLKPGYRHAYSRRVFFWDEDAPGAGSAEGYDAAGKLYRLVNTYSYPFYETPGGVGGMGGTAFVSTDLVSGVAVSGATGNCADPRCGLTAIEPKDERYFSPEAMAGEGVR